eukprot:6057176-Prymnesium_polylepis.1
MVRLDDAIVWRHTGLYGATQERERAPKFAEARDRQLAPHEEGVEACTVKSDARGMHARQPTRGRGRKHHRAVAEKGRQGTSRRERCHAGRSHADRRVMRTARGVANEGPRWGRSQRLSRGHEDAEESDAQHFPGTLLSSSRMHWIIHTCGNDRYSFTRRK